MRAKDDVPIIRKKIGGIAGGTGISPIYPVMMHGLRYEDGVEFSLIHCNKSSKDILLKDELVQLAEVNTENKKFKLHLLVDKEPLPEKIANVKCSTGYVTK